MAITVLDAINDRSPEAHDCSIARCFPRPGETGLARGIVALLDSGARGTR